MSSGSLAWGRFVLWITSVGQICLLDPKHGADLSSGSLAWGRYVFWIPSMGQIYLVDP